MGEVSTFGLTSPTGETETRKEGEWGGACVEQFKETFESPKMRRLSLCLFLCPTLLHIQSHTQVMEEMKDFLKEVVDVKGKRVAMMGLKDP